MVAEIVGRTTHYNRAPHQALLWQKAAISISHNPVQHDKTKHIEVDKHFIKEKIEKGTIRRTYILTREQLVDIFTKGLQKSSFEDFICKLDIINIYDPT